MRTMEDLRRRLSNVEDVQSIVGTMKTMAAVQVRQYESAANAISKHLHTVELGFHVLQRELPTPACDSDPASPTSRRAAPSTAFQDGTSVRGATTLNDIRAAIVFGSDQGLCGNFNQVIVNHTVSQIADGTRWHLIAVGHRVAALLESALEVVETANIEHVFRGPVTVSDITGVMHDLMPLVSQWQLDGIDQIDIHFNSRRPAASFLPETFRLFPVATEFLERCRQQPWDSRRLPIYTMDRRALLAAVIRQYLFVGLYRACAESRASENASRIAAMQAASKNIERRLHELKTEFNQSRQSAITEEILDIAAGVEALK